MRHFACNPFLWTPFCFGPQPVSQVLTTLNSLIVRAFLERPFLHASLSFHTVNYARFIKSQPAFTITALCGTNLVMQQPIIWSKRKFHCPPCGRGPSCFDPSQSASSLPRSTESDIPRAFLMKKPGYDSAISGQEWYRALAMAVDIPTNRIGASG